MSAQLPVGFTVRAPRMDEVEQVFEFVQKCEMAEMGVSDTNLTDMRENWKRPKFDLATDAILVFDPTGKIAGYAYGSELHQPAMAGNGFTGPEFNGLGIGGFLIDWLETRMTRQIPQFGPEMEIVFTNWIVSTNDAAHNLLESHGYNQTREFWQMRIVNAEPPAAPEWPQGISIRPMVVGQDNRLVYDVFEETFSDHWGHVTHPYEDYARWHYERPTFDPSLWFLAIDDATGEVAGITLDSIEEGIGWVGTLAVRRPYRKLGLGLALLRFSFGELYQRGATEVRLMVDGESLTGATRLYTGAGMNAAIRFARFAKIVRPGISLAVKELAE